MKCFFWKNRFDEISKNGFNDILEVIGVGKCKHYFLRLEFQGRGAPHVHCLIWYEQMLNIEEIDKYFFANLPDECYKSSHTKIKAFMTHNCIPANCYKKGNKYRFSFPKDPVPFTFYDDEGVLKLKRNEENCRTVDFCPLLILQTNSHAHVNILRSEEMPDGSPYGIDYVLKYNFEPEPNMIIEGEKIQDKIRFKARVVSYEEATSRIFSFNFSEKDVGSIFIDTVPPSLLSAKSDSHGNQTQMDCIGKYFHRPSYLDRMTILEYYSAYDMRSINSEVIERPEKNDIERPPKIFGSIFKMGIRKFGFRFKCN